MEVQAINVHGITGVEVTEDGRHALIRVRSGENEANLAFPFEELMPLMQTASTAFAKCQQAQDLDPNTKHLLPCESCQIVPSPDFEHMIFSFRLPGGMEMSFPVPRRHAERMREVMEMFIRDPGMFPAGKPQ
jgi:hypothetical protein